MICPECGAEYGEGIFGCPDCRVALVSPPPPGPPPEYVEYITVMETRNPVVLAMVKSVLSSAGIRHYVKGGVLQDLFRIGAAEVQVRREDESAARDLLGDRGAEDGKTG